MNCKQVKYEELEYYRIASFNNISPKIISIIPYDKGYNLYTKKYKTFFDIYNNKLYDFYSYKDQTLNLVKKLHTLGIFHGDFHEDNIVFDTDSHKAYLIDYGLSKYIKDINNEIYLCDNIYISDKHEKFNNIDELLKAELYEVEYIFNSYLKDTFK